MMTTADGAIEIAQFPCLSDNYGVLVHLKEPGLTLSIDAPDAGVIAQELKTRGWTLTHILTTHHHHDHVGGNAELKSVFGVEIIGPAGEADHVPGVDRQVSGGDRFELGGVAFEVIDTPGHTLGHIAYNMPAHHTAFVGDAMFAMGCGRVFEGTPEQMWSSLSRLMALPDETVVYCGHEYTAANAAFALTVDPDNPALQARAAEVQRLRADGRPTLPTTIAQEKATNPFLRAADPAIRAHLDMVDATDVEVFTRVRRLKDAA